MAEPVLQRAAAAGSNYWLDCGKWGQMQCIIREPVDSGSLSQWLVINKIIGERWQRFLEFFLICMSFCAEFFMTPFFICEGWFSNGTVSCSLTCLCSGFKLAVARGCVPAHNAMCTCILQRPGICNLQSFAAQVLFGAIAFACLNVPQGFLSCILSCKKRFKVSLWIFELLRMSADVDSLLFFLQWLQ